MTSVSLVDGHIDGMTDEQIIKALPMVAYGGHYCNKCKYKYEKGECRCGLKGCRITRNALDLINRQKAENDELQHKIYELEIELEESRDAHIRTAAEKDAEIERLQKHNKEYGFCNLLGNCLVYSKNLKDYNDMRKGLKSEARKEFAKKLKRICEKDGFVDRCDIMRLLKEMGG